MVSKFGILGLIIGLGVILAIVLLVGEMNSSDNTGLSQNPLSPDGIETNIVKIVQGSGTLGCEETSIGCYDPVKAKTYVGNIITWKNIDSSAHTVTVGTPDDITGFDSGLIFAGKEFFHEFSNIGIYDYFCMVHPWMTGQVIVDE